VASIKAGLPVVAIVGRPNVGKSTLFNRFVGGRQAIVEDRARTTRDRMYGDAEWNGRRFIVVDTGGLEVDPADPIELKVQEQARLAIGEADVILFLVDAVSGMTPADEEAAELLRRATKPVIVAANKADNTAREADAAEFYALGWDETYAISASHGRGTGDLLDAIVWALPAESADEIARKAREKEADEWARDVAAGRLEPWVVGEGTDEDQETDGERDADAEPSIDEAKWDAAMAAAAEDDEPASIAFVGRPNVGKSSLLNALLGEDRAIVSEVPGTTRDAIDTTLEWGRSQIVLIDTAGIRRRGKVAGGPAAERFSTLRSLKAIGRADVAVLVIDAVEGLTAQDAHVAGYVIEEGRGLVVAVNKWDLVEDKTDRTFDQYVEWIRNDTPFLEFAPVVSISAKTHQRVGKVLELAVDIWGERRKRIPTGELNRVIRAATERQQPPVVKGRRPKIFYGTQAAIAPPTFVFFANDAGSVHFSYRRYLENRIRDEFGFHGTPIKLIFRDRASVKLPRRRRPENAARRKAKASAGGPRPKR
jgi:GTP-binding protein